MAKAKNIHTAVTPDGVTHKRVSESRVYTHCVAVRLSYTHALAQARKLQDVDRRNYDYHVCEAQVLPGSYDEPNLIWPGKTYTRVVTPEQHQRHVDEVAKAPNAQAYAEVRRDERVARVEADKAAGRYDRWAILGWNGSLVLAQRLAASDASKPYYAEHQILTATLEQRGA